MARQPMAAKNPDSQNKEISMNSNNLHSIHRVVLGLALVTVVFVSSCTWRPISPVDPPNGTIVSVQTVIEAPLLLCVLDDHSA
jgi:hypothetical protein